MLLRSAHKTFLEDSLPLLQRDLLPRLLLQVTTQVRLQYWSWVLGPCHRSRPAFSFDFAICFCFPI